jgi:hypothetical protein
MEDMGQDKRYKDNPSADEVRQFIKDSLADHHQNKKFKLGVISKAAQKRIEEASGVRGVRDIFTDTSSVIHTYVPKHNLDPDDMLYAAEVINTTTDIKLSEDRHQDTDVLIFKKDIGGDLTVLAEAHVGNGYLLVNDCWRQKKSRSRTTGQSPSANVQDETPITTQKDTSSNDASSVSPAPPEKSSPPGGKFGKNDEDSSGKAKPEAGLSTIRDKYRSAKSVEGDEDDINVKGEEIRGRWRLVEAEVPTASHDEETFHGTEGFPETEAGSNVNDRDYAHDRAAQEMVIKVGMNYDSRALAFDSPVVVTKDGIVISGNNRTMSSKIAARNGTDAKYIEALKRKARKFGFREEDIGKFKHPRVVFEVEAPEKYDTDLFAKFNDPETKKMSPIETAVKMSKRVKMNTLEAVSNIVGEYETMGDLYKNDKATEEIFTILQKHNLLSEFDLPQYFTDRHITRAGEEFLENTMIGSVVNEANIRKLNKPGVKSIRQKLVRSILPLVENRGMKTDYAITNELNRAIDVASDVTLHREQFKDVKEYLKQGNAFEEKPDEVVSIFAEKLEDKGVTQKGFAEYMLAVCCASVWKRR